MARKIWLKVSGSNIIYPYNIKEYINTRRQENLKYEFEYDETQESLISSSIYEVIQTQMPSNSETENIIEIEPILSGSVYVQQFSLTSSSLEEIEERKSLEWESIRRKRNELLIESDWTQFQDSPITGSKLNEWQNYRQSLRDITDETDPYNLTWPTKPN